MAHPIGKKQIYWRGGTVRTRQKEELQLPPSLEGAKKREVQQEREKVEKELGGGTRPANLSNWRAGRKLAGGIGLCSWGGRGKEE